MPEKLHRPMPALQRDILALLRGDPPPDGAPPPSADGALRLYECGGYLHRLWTRDGRAGTLPSAWADALARAHRKTATDTLAALAEFRSAGRILMDAGIPF